MTTFVVALRLVCYIVARPVDGVVSVRLMSARDWDEVRLQALDTGKTLERRYTNADGETVDWRFVQILTIDELPSGDLVGREVYSYRHVPEPSDENPKLVNPEKAPTSQTGV
jgi:Domain of unknown function (DUF4288)